MSDMRRSALRCAVLVLAALGALASGATAATPTRFMAAMTLAPAALAVAPDEGPPATTGFDTVPAGRLAREAVAIESARGGTIERISVEHGTRFAVLDPNDCEGRTLAPGGVCTVVVVAAPAGAGDATLEDRLLVQLGATTREGALTAWTR